MPMPLRAVFSAPSPAAGSRTRARRLAVRAAPRSAPASLAVDLLVGRADQEHRARQRAPRSPAARQAPRRPSAARPSCRSRRARSTRSPSTRGGLRARLPCGCTVSWWPSSRQGRIRRRSRQTARTSAPCARPAATSTRAAPRGQVRRHGLGHARGRGRVARRRLQGSPRQQVGDQGRTAARVAARSGDGDPARRSCATRVNLRGGRSGAEGPAVQGHARQRVAAHGHARGPARPAR